MGWQDDFKLRTDLVQKDMYAFDKTLRELGGTAHGPTVSAAHLLKAAISAGWVESPPAEVGDFKGEPRWYIGGKDVDEHAPGSVLWYGGQVGAHYGKLLEIPPN